jgi:cytochrome c oxidase cbb3-type subunit 2
MPPYALLERTPLQGETIGLDLLTNRRLGVPYSDEMIELAEDHLRAQVDIFATENASLVEQYPGVQVRDFDGNPAMVSELDALIAYMQVLGTMVDFSTYEADAPENLR